MDHLRAGKVAEKERTPHSLSLTHTTPGISRGYTRSLMTGPGHTNHKAITDISDEIWAKVASHMRDAPVLELPIMGEDPGSEEEVITPAPRKRNLKSGKIQTTNTTVLCKITWPHIGGLYLHRTTCRV